MRQEPCLPENHTLHDYVYQGSIIRCFSQPLIIHHVVTDIVGGGNHSLALHISVYCPLLLRRLSLLSRPDIAPRSPSLHTYACTTVRSFIRPPKVCPIRMSSVLWVEVDECNTTVCCLT